MMSQLVRKSVKTILLLLGLFVVLFLCYFIEEKFRRPKEDLRETSNTNRPAHNTPKNSENTLNESEYMNVHRYGADETLGNERLNAVGNNIDYWLPMYLNRAIVDTNHTGRWRNYCVQHLATHYIRHQDSTSIVGLRLAAATTEREVAEVAVYSLARVSKELNLDPSHEVFLKTKQILNENLSGTRHPNMQIAAIRGAALMSLHDFDNRLRELARDEFESLQVRIAAIDAIGVLSIAEYENDIITLRNSKIPLIKQAATIALRRLHPLESVVPKDKQTVETLRKALLNTHFQVRNEATVALRSFGRYAKEALPELCCALRLLDSSSQEREIVSYLDLIRSFGPDGHLASPALCGILEERSSIYTGRDKEVVNRLRAYALLTITEIGRAEDASSFIADALANSDDTMQLYFAAGAYAVSSLEERGTPFVPLLLRALKPEFRDNFLALDGYRSAITDSNRTSARLESIRALGRIGSAAAESIPLLESLAKSDSPASDRLPAWSREAQAALSEIRSAPK